MVAVIIYAGTRAVVVAIRAMKKNYRSPHKNSSTTHKLSLCLIILMHRYLHISGETFGRPISGQSEVSAYTYTEPGNEWKAMVRMTKF